MIYQSSMLICTIMAKLSKSLLVFFHKEISLGIYQEVSWGISFVREIHVQIVYFHIHKPLIHHELSYLGPICLGIRLSLWQRWLYFCPRSWNYIFLGLDQEPWCVVYKYYIPLKVDANMITNPRILWIYVILKLTKQSFYHSWASFVSNIYPKQYHILWLNLCKICRQGGCCTDNFPPYHCNKI